jgi:hypothetical protein
MDLSDLSKLASVYCWGPEYGEVYRQGHTLLPVKLDIGGRTGCAVTNDFDLNGTGGITCWGLHNDVKFGRLTGDVGKFSKQGSPAHAGAGAEANNEYFDVGVGDRHACSLNRVSGSQGGYAGKLFCWGATANGRLGIGSAMDEGRHVFGGTRVGTAEDWTSLHVGGAMTVVTNLKGERWAFGRTSGGQLGAGQAVDLIEPTLLKAAVEGAWPSTSLGPEGGCSVTGEAGAGKLYCWGAGRYGDNGLDIGWTTGPQPVSFTAP